MNTANNYGVNEEEDSNDLSQDDIDPEVVRERKKNMIPAEWGHAAVDSSTNGKAIASCSLVDTPPPPKSNLPDVEEDHSIPPEWRMASQAFLEIAAEKENVN